MTASQHCPHCGTTVKPALTRKRSRRHVENDEYAAFTRRVLRAYGRRIAGRATSTPSRTLTGCSAKSSPALSRGCVLACATSGYSLAEIGLRLGVTRQAAHQRWGRHPAMTARGAAAAIGPEPEHGSGPVATADDVITSRT